MILLPKGIKPKRNKPKRYKNKAYLKHIHNMSCCVCWRRPVEAHHLLRGPVRGMGLKAGDDWIIPLCQPHHQALHQSGDEVGFLKRDGINGMELAKKLFKEWKCQKN